MPRQHAHERFLRREVRIGGLAAIAEHQSKVATRQRRNHQEMIRADAVVKVVGPVGEPVEIHVKILEKTARVVLPLD